MAVVATALCGWSLMDVSTRARDTVGQFAELSDDYVQYDEEDEYRRYGEKAAVDQPLEVVLSAIKTPDTAFDPFSPRGGSATFVAASPETTTKAETSVMSVVLSAIWVQGDIALALVNNRICQTGSRFGELYIEDVATVGIWVSHPEGRDFLNLGDTIHFSSESQPETLATLAHHEG